jgi:hypothetical protein
MKKLILSLAMIAAGTAAFAQKPTTGTSTLETQFSLNMGGANGFTTPEIRYRYFLNDGMAARVRFNVSTNSNTTDIDDGAASNKKTGTINNSSFGFNLGLGLEKHLGGTEKLSPYFGGELMFGFAGANQTTGDGSSNGTTWTGAGDKYETSGGGTTQLGLAGVFGADYYFTNSIYIGGEMGWGFAMTSTAEQTDKSTPSGATGVESTISKGSSGFSLGMMNFATTAVRFGIKF